MGHQSEFPTYISKGAKVKGQIKKITQFGVFLDLQGGVEGCLYVTDITWGRVDVEIDQIPVGESADFLKVGQELEVLVLEIDKERFRASVGLKQLTENPWEKVTEKYPLNLKVRGKVTRFVPYGAFVQLEPGVEGLVSVSELSWTKNITQPGDVLQQGQEIEAIVIFVSKDEQKISLSLRQLEPNPNPSVKTGMNTASKTYLITKTGLITKWIARQPLLIDEVSLQKIFPNLPSDEEKREKFLAEKRDVLDQMFDAVASYFDEGDPLETHEDPKGKASPDWEKAEATLDDGESYRYFCQPCPVDLDLLREIAEADNSEMPQEISERLKDSES